MTNQAQADECRLVILAQSEESFRDTREKALRLFRHYYIQTASTFEVEGTPKLTRPNISIYPATNPIKESYLYSNSPKCQAKFVEFRQGEWMDLELDNLIYRIHFKPRRA
jgi:hypothetical protein